MFLYLINCKIKFIFSSLYYLNNFLDLYGFLAFNSAARVGGHKERGYLLCDNRMRRTIKDNDEQQRSSCAPLRPWRVVGPRPCRPSPTSRLPEPVSHSDCR